MAGKQAIKKVSAALLIVAGVLLCIDTLFAYNYSSDWNFGVVLPAILGFISVVYALKLLILKRPVFKSRRLRIIFITFVIFCVLFFIVIEALIIADPFVHRSELAGKVDAVIVLGCGIWPDGRPTLALISRLDKSIEYYEKNPDITVIVSGGQGSNEPFAEASAMESYLLERGIPGNKIVIEDKSSSTRENFEFSRKLIDIPSGERVKIVFITNDFHVLRSRILAERFGFDAYSISAPTPKVIIFNSYLREFFAFIKTMLLDY
jgi:uncharacterized SAM-binding protein YcdF (DUF218 family)